MVDHREQDHLRPQRTATQVHSVRMSTTQTVADAGVVGAVLAALCCAGAPIILALLAATGLSFLRNDAILLPVMGVCLAIALWGFVSAKRLHHRPGPLAAALAGTVALVAGVVFVHGFPAKQVIGVGVLLLLGATLWNARLRRSCAVTMGDDTP